MMYCGAGFKAHAERAFKTKQSPPTIDQVVTAARDVILAAITKQEFAGGEAPAFDVPDAQLFWLKGWPVGEWVTSDNVFGDKDQHIVALQIFDPAIRESIYWFVQSADRRRYDAMMTKPRETRSVTQVELDLVETPIAKARIAQGHDIKRQVTCAAGRVDIWDKTANEIIECKATGYASDLVAAVNQLHRYGPLFSGAALTIAVPKLDGDGLWLGEILRQSGYGIIEVDGGGT